MQRSARLKLHNIPAGVLLKQPGVSFFHQEWSFRGVCGPSQCRPGDTLAFLAANSGERTLAYSDQLQQIFEPL
jgi:hypothetical protein